MKPNDIKFKIFQIISFIFILFFLYNLHTYSFDDSLITTLLMWSTVVVATPFPSAAIILTLPIKIYLNIPMYISQIIASILSIFMIIKYTSYAPSMISKIMDKKMYYIFAISIVSSTTLSMILDKVIDYYTRSIKINTLSMSALVIISSILVYMYKTDIFIAENKK